MSATKTKKRAAQTEQFQLQPETFNQLPRAFGGYLSAWNELAGQNPKAAGMLRDIIACYRANGSANANDVSLVGFSCKRPACPKCHAEKHRDTAEKIATMCSPERWPGRYVLACTFTTQGGLPERIESAVTAAIAVSAKFSRTKAFEASVTAWSRTVEVVPAGSRFCTQLNLVMRFGADQGRVERRQLAVKMLQAFEERHFVLSQICGLRATDARFAGVVAHHLRPFGRSGFNPRHFSGLTDVPLCADPDLLKHIYTGLHGRRLVTLTGRTD